MSDETKIPKGTPGTIYLDLGTDPADVDNFNGLTEVTWSADNATGHGIEYRRRAPLPANVAEAVGRLEQFVEFIEGNSESFQLSKSWFRTILEHMKEPTHEN